jgi:hypothetical protein
MNQTAYPEAERLRRRASLAAWACRGVALAIPAALLASWIVGDAATAALSQLRMVPGHAVSTVQLAAAAGLSLLPALAMARSLFGVATCFDGFARGDLFGAGQPRALAGAGRWLIVSGALALIVPTLLGLALTLNAAPGARVLAITLSSDAVLGLLFGTLLWALGHLWGVARAIAAENAAFV